MGNGEKREEKSLEQIGKAVGLLYFPAFSKNAPTNMGRRRTPETPSTSQKAGRAKVVHVWIAFLFHVGFFCFRPTCHFTSRCVRVCCFVAAHYPVHTFHGRNVFQNSNANRGYGKSKAQKISLAAFEKHEDGAPQHTHTPGSSMQ